MTGPEKVYKIVTTSTSDLTATLSSSGSQYVFILDSCDGSSCKAYSYSTATYYAAPAGTYYIVVDGYSGSSGSFTLSVSCPTNVLDCTNATPISCGQTVSGTTVGGPMNATRYSCATGYYEAGPEKVYTITTTTTSDLYATLSSNSGGQNIFILSSCDVSSCVAYGLSYATYLNAPAGTYYIVVDGYYTTGSSFTLSVSCATNILDCSSAIPISCGQTVSGTTVGGNTNVTRYSCNSGYYEYGPERVYTITTASTGDLTAMLSTSGSLQVFILNSCDPSSCAAYGYGSATYQNAPAGTYYIVVDGSYTTGSSFTLSVSCASNILDCTNATPLTCNQPVNGTTVGGSTDVNRYSCASSYLETGPEKVYTITTTSTGNLRVDLSNTSNSNLQVFILNNCNAQSCVSYSSYSATYYSAPPGTYYVVVDGYMGASGSYTLTAICPSAAIDCSSAIPISCGQQVSGTTVGAPSNANTYSCTSGTYMVGPERVYTITTTSAGDLTATLNANTSGQYVYILNSCSGSSCMASGYSVANYQNAPAGTYYIVVDGSYTTGGSYTLSVACSSNILDCTTATPLTCNQQVSGTTVGGAQNVNRYSCTSYLETGPEKVYTVTTTSAGNLTVNISSSNNLYVHILTSCDPQSCVAYSYYSATYYNAPAGTYYIVVDGYQGASGTYTLNVVCPESAISCSTATPITCGQQVTGTTVGGTSNTNTYSCTSGLMIGPDKVYSITTTTTTDLTVNLTSSGSQYVYILDSCDGSSCVAYGSYSATYYSAPAGTYYIVVDGYYSTGSAFALDVACPTNVLDCSNATPLTCGQQVTGTTVGGASNVNSYSCASGWTESGPERVYTITTTTAGNLTVNLSSSSLQVFILSGCNTSACVAYGTSTATYFNAPAGTYYIVVDGYQGTSGTYTLSVSCPAPLDCSNAVPLTCGQSVTGSTIGASSNVPSYPCQSSWDESGPENVYTITTTATGDITATLSASSADVDVFILSSCSASSCLAGGDVTATYYNAPAGTYYVVVEGYQGASGTYTLNVACSGSCATPSVQSSNLNFPVITPNSIQVAWSKGNGSRSLIKMNSSSSFTTPVNGTDPTGSAVYTGGEQTIYNGNGSGMLVVTGLTAGVNYCFRVYDVNCNGNTTVYNGTTATDNPMCQYTLFPLHLLSFTGVAIRTDAVLTWITSDELNMNKYEVERSADGITYTRIGSVPSRNSATQATYHYADAGILEGSLPGYYYRLKQVENDGNFSYSTVVYLKKSGSDDYVKPLNTIFNSSINMSSSLSTAEKIQFRLVNATGQVLYTKQMVLHQGASLFSLSDIPFTSKGFYALQVVREKTIVSYKMQKL